MVGGGRETRATRKKRGKKRQGKTRSEENVYRKEHSKQ